MPSSVCGVEVDASCLSHEFSKDCVQAPGAHTRKQRWLNSLLTGTMNIEEIGMEKNEIEKGKWRKRWVKT